MTLCDNAHADKALMEIERAKAKAEAIAKQQIGALAAIKRVLGVDLDSSDLEWEDYPKAEFFIENQRFKVECYGDEWHVAAYVTAKRDYGRSKFTFFGLGPYKHIPDIREVSDWNYINRPADLIAVGVCKAQEA